MLKPVVTYQMLIPKDSGEVSVLKLSGSSGGLILSAPHQKNRRQTGLLSFVKAKKEEADVVQMTEIHKTPLHPEDGWSNHAKPKLEVSCCVPSTCLLIFVLT